MRQRTIRYCSVPPGASPARELLPECTGSSVDIDRPRSEWKAAKPLECSASDLLFHRQVADIVVAPVIISSHQEGSAQPVKEPARQRECAWWEIKRTSRIEVRQPGENNPSDGSHDPQPQYFREAANHGDLAIEKQHREEADNDRERSPRSHHPAHLQ